MDDPEIIEDFLMESNENLARLDQEMVELEKRPKDAALLGNIFRTIHTIKGTCGFLGFSVLERMTHVGENILGQVRNGDRDLTPSLVSLILEMVEGVRKELRAIEATASESGDSHHQLIERLQAVCEDRKSAAVPQPTTGEPAA
ncbi:MAG: Hpt domain-containing protein [Acidobacteria bacterium]|nr:Hpt domain-containing protein [Acidobacteriota bacterium]